MSTSSTLVLIKPDAVRRNLIGTIISRFENAGFDIAHMRSIQPDEELLADYYNEHIGEPYYSNLVDYMQSGVVIALVLEGPNAVKEIHNIVGNATEPRSAKRGTIRGDLADDSYDRAAEEGRALYNLVHASDSQEAVERETELWFKN